MGKAGRWSCLYPQVCPFKSPLWMNRKMMLNTYEPFFPLHTAKQGQCL